jgi:hypothetical protein
MHRGGTSAATRLISLLGPALPRDEDLVPPSPKNPRGYWESMSLVAVNTRALAAVGSDFRFPRQLGEGWERDPRLDGLRAEARDAFRLAYPTAPWVWKDPRTCLTLAFWRATLSAPPVAVLLTRNPLEIAASAVRTGAEQRTLYTIAVWERYLRNALAQAAGLPVLVTRYDDLLTAPLAWCRRVAAFLAGAGVPVREPRDSEVIAFTDASMRHSSFTAADLDRAEGVSGAQRRLFELLEQLEGKHAVFVTPQLPPETPENEAMFAAQRAVVAARSAVPPLERWARAVSLRARRARDLVQQRVA